MQLLLLLCSCRSFDDAQQATPESHPLPAPPPRCLAPCATADAAAPPPTWSGYCPPDSQWPKGGKKTVFVALTMKFTPSAAADCGSKTWAGGPKKFSGAMATLFKDVFKATDKENMKYASIAKGLSASSCADVRGPGARGAARGAAGARGAVHDQARAHAARRR
jgi:hypothetical protein